MDMVFTANAGLTCQGTVLPAAFRVMWIFHAGAALQGCDLVLMLPTMFHSIGVGNMTPAGVKLIYVDITAAVATPARAATVRRVEKRSRCMCCYSPFASSLMYCAAFCR